MTVDFEVKFILLEYYPTEIYCFTEGGTPYGVLIGKPLKSHLPERVTFLARCEDGDFKKGDILTAQAIEQSKSLPPLKTFTANINGNTRVNQLLGAQHPALWCKIVEK
ncbi:hypothetical protein EAX61_03415 [Dokdonia sinensis]|uniref:Uncharacterized protein n=2 Tax=Dokdonia sinensis TaxID=2479847 RepID=A0A3M0GE57_9FLAO|nr:hypothetical protein EAX61_03415 [Dokdonia sinensis]